MIVFLALNNLALIYEEGGKCDEAIKAYEDSIKLKRQYDDGNLVEISTDTYIKRGNDFPYLYCTRWNIQNKGIKRQRFLC